MGVYIKGMEMPKDEYIDVRLFPDGTAITQTGRNPFYKEFRVIAVHPHGRLIDADTLIADLKRQCKEVFRIDAVSPDDFWITRNEAYNERLWTTWCESFYDYINVAPTVIPAEEGE